MATLIIGVLFFGILGTVIYRNLKKHKKGDIRCGCSCGSCPTSKSCHSKQ